MKKRYLAAAILIIAASLLSGAAAVATASPYPKAEIEVCNLLDANPTDSGVVQVVDVGTEAVQRGYITAEDYAGMMVDAVTYRCPEYYGLVMRSVERHRTGGYLA